MAVTLQILDESEYGPENRKVVVPDGATITVRRHRQGADVIAVPGEPSAAPDRADADAFGPERLSPIENAHTAALARRANAEAELLELDVAKRRQEARARDTHVTAESLSVQLADRQVSVCAKRIADEAELRIDIDPAKIPWLIQQLAWALGEINRERR